MNTCQPNRDRETAGKDAGAPDGASKISRFWGSFAGMWTQRRAGARFERKRLMRVEHRFLAQGNP